MHSTRGGSASVSRWVSNQSDKADYELKKPIQKILGGNAGARQLTSHAPSYTHISMTVLHPGAHAPARMDLSSQRLMHRERQLEEIRRLQQAETIGLDSHEKDEEESEQTFDSPGSLKAAAASYKSPHSPTKSPTTPERDQGQSAFEMLRHLYPSLAQVNPIIPTRGRVVTDLNVNAQALLWKHGRRGGEGDAEEEKEASPTSKDIAAQGVR